MKLITAIIRPGQLEEVRKALESYGVQGLTVSSAHGYGRQRGHTEIYRGAEYTVDLHEKVRIEVLCSDGQAWDLVDIIVASKKYRHGRGRQGLGARGGRGRPGPHRRTRHGRHLGVPGPPGRLKRRPHACRHQSVKPAAHLRGSAT